MKYKIDYKALILSILITLGVGFFSAMVTRNSMDAYVNLDKPPLSPSSEVFPTVWMILYILMGISAYLIYQSKDYMKNSALCMYVSQLLVNFGWPIIFFNMEQYFLAFLILSLLWIMVLLMVASFYSINKTAAYLQIPYLLWITFALYLNVGISILNI